MKIEQEPEILLDLVAPTPQQQKVLDMIAKMLAGGFILWRTGEELLSELRKYQSSKKGVASASLY